jgi:hypothetical protein
MSSITFAGEIESADEAVMAAADDEDVGHFAFGKPPQAA